MMTMPGNKTYFVTLTPQNLFFFGGEQGDKADYYLKGSFVPQQTALLGLVRHQLLLQGKAENGDGLMHNRKIHDQEQATNWIGDVSFEYDKDNSFGRIVSLSPCCLVQKRDKKITKYLPFHQPYASSLRKLGDNYYLPEFDPKKSYPEVWQSLDRKHTICNGQNELYTEVERIGVDKNYNGKTEDKSFFKQIWLKMAKGISFGFYVTLAGDTSLESGFVTFGKESSSFYMDIVEEEPMMFENDSEPTAILLTSDTYVTEDIYCHCEFAITETIPFRNIVNKASATHNYFGSPNKSKVRLQLFKRGSIYYAKNDKISAIVTAITSHINFRKIGYNHFHLLNIPF